jgi:tetratricopeptide (TPR) repeat protein
LYHLGTVIWDEGDNTQARAHHQEAVDICRALGLTDIVAVQALHGLGETSWMAGEPDLAITLLGESLTLARQIGDKSYEAENLLMMGYSSVGTMGNANYQKAQEYFNQSLAISEAANLAWHSVATLAALGLAQGDTGDYERGLATVGRSLTMAEALGLTRYRTVALDQLGYLLLDLNLLDQAAEAFTLGIQLALRAELHLWLPRLQAHLAISRLRQGDLSVETELQNALMLARRDGQAIHVAHCLEGLAELLIARGEPAQAIRYADELLALAEPRGLRDMAAQAHRWRGEAMLAAGQLETAEEELKQAAALATDIGRVRLQWDVHAALHRLYKARGQAELADRHETIVRTIVAQICENLQTDELRTGLPTSH